MHEVTDVLLVVLDTARAFAERSANLAGLTNSTAVMHFLALYSGLAAFLAVGLPLLAIRLLRGRRDLPSSLGEGLFARRRRF